MSVDVSFSVHLALVWLPMLVDVCGVLKLWPIARTIVTGQVELGIDGHDVDNFCKVTI